MSGETGSAVDGGLHDTATTLPSSHVDNQVTPTRSNQTDPVCPTCGQVPSQGLRQYNGVSISGHSHVILGDMLNPIFYCCSSEGGPEASRGSSSPSSTKPPSRSGTFGTLRSTDKGRARPVTHGILTTNPDGIEVVTTTGNISSGPESAADTIALPLIGLKVVQESTNWTTIYSAHTSYVKLEIQDALISDEKLLSNHEYPFVPLAHDWTFSELFIEVHQYTRFGRLKIKKGDACEVWLPETGLQVMSNQSTLTIRFSNCNKLRPPGSYPTQNGTAVSVTTYHPEQPNVIFRMDFPTTDTADEFRTHILRREAIDANTNSVFIQESPHVMIMHSLRDTDTEMEKPCVLVWKRTAGTETDPSVEIHDLVAISDRFDLDIVAAGKEMSVTMGYVDRLTYFPAFDQPDLPQNVKRTLDGAPTKSKIEGGDLPGNKLCLMTTPSEAKQLVNYILSRTLPWKLKAIFHQVDVKMYSSKIYKLGGDNYVSQLTMWTNQAEDKIRIAIRTSGTTDTGRKSISEVTKCMWFSITLTQAEDRPMAARKENILTIKNIDRENGDCLSTSDLRPMNTDAKISSSGALEIRFSDADQLQEFRGVATDRFLRMGDS